MTFALFTKHSPHDKSWLRQLEPDDIDAYFCDLSTLLNIVGQSGIWYLKQPTLDRSQWDDLMSIANGLYIHVGSNPVARKFLFMAVEKGVVSLCAHVLSSLAAESGSPSFSTNGVLTTVGLDYCKWCDLITTYFAPEGWFCDGSHLYSNEEIRRVLFYHTKTAAMLRVTACLEAIAMALYPNDAQTQEIFIRVMKDSVRTGKSE